MFEKITENVEIHQTLPDIPNLPTENLKKEWDKGCRIIKEMFNKQVDELIKLQESFKIKIVTNQETKTNIYIDDKQIYVKRINLGKLPNGEIQLETGLSLSEINIEKIEGIAGREGGSKFPLPFPGRDLSSTIEIVLLADGKIRITCNSDRSALSGYIDIYYTKKEV